ncbi:MAG: FAD-dependent oxidoreductase [Clostridiales Family XIII bacterium]|jgi:thioredoxin reductase/NAD-dependent dihydropyrimidine dehydrogenase PreA subunit|nr:FAD-dependent oxidoreductase [Clostridiales Family XIII bacterium]
MTRYDLVVVGAGPAGLSAAAEAAKAGLSVCVFDENAKPGGQLFKQIHKFFGSKEHRAKTRGIRIGEELLAEAAAAGVEVVLDAAVLGLFAERELTVRVGDEVRHVKGDAIVVATGASENMVPFENWTLPGVIGAGAAQTMMNLHGVRPGKRVLMLGSGNVGLVVSFQLLQAGCEVVAIADLAPSVGGYGVHASKLARTGVPFYLSHTIVRAEGTDHVERVTIAEVDASVPGCVFVPRSEKTFDVDTICIAVGLTPMAQLLNMAGCEMKDDPARGGLVPVLDAYGETSIPGVYAAGDVSGIEEASAAMIEGRIAGLAAARRLGFLEEGAFAEAVAAQEAALAGLRKGMFAPGNKGKVFEATDEGVPIAKNLLRKGFLSEEEAKRFWLDSRVKPENDNRYSGVHPVIECTQNIPCNPCQDACAKGCILVGADITALPVVGKPEDCTACGLCVASCSGQAIFLVNEDAGDGFAEVTLPYEFLPLPESGQKGAALARDGQALCAAEVVKAAAPKAFDKTCLLTMRVPKEYAQTARFFKAEVGA